MDAIYLFVVLFALASGLWCGHCLTELFAS